jgi:ATP synthase subunit 6
MFISPLEQFSINILIPFFIQSIDFSFTNSSLILSLTFIFTISLFNAVFSNSKLIPNSWQLILEFLYDFILNQVLTENVKKDSTLYFPLLFSIFLFILSMNLAGMVPYSFTVTSHIIVTFGIALIAFTAINLIGIRIHGFHLMSFFLPAGAPIALAPLLVMIEVVSYSFRVISLALRLFANMMSGHCLLKILAGFSWTMLTAGGILSVIHLLPLVVIFAIIGLELAIAFLQAYVFVVLLCIYLNDAISLH